MWKRAVACRSGLISARPLREPIRKSGFGREQPRRTMMATGPVSWRARQAKDRAMRHTLISGDNHIDLTYCPTDLWSAQTPARWKKNAPRVEERNDGQHWFVDDKDRGLCCGRSDWHDQA